MIWYVEFLAFHSLQLNKFVFSPKNDTQSHYSENDLRHEDTKGLNHIEKVEFVRETSHIEQCAEYSDMDCTYTFVRPRK